MEEIIFLISIFIFSVLIYNKFYHYFKRIEGYTDEKN